MTPSRALVYVYCLVYSRRTFIVPKVRPRLPDATAPRAVKLDGPIWMILSDVSAERYSEDALVEGLQDLTWVSRCAVGHEAVAQACLAKGTVVPMKLLTIFASAERAKKEIGARKAEILETVRQLAGRLEWGIRLVTGRATPAPVKPVRTPDSGRAYLEAKRRLTAARSRPQAGGGERLSEQIVKSLSRIASDLRRRESIEQVPGSRVLLDVAWLVPRRQSTVFQREVRQLAARAKREGYDLILNGPWPPYHFVSGGQGA